MAQVQPWERQPGESAPAYEAFEIYRDLPPGTRSGARVVQELGKSKSLIDRWSSEHDWVERVQEYDAFAERRKLEARLKAIDDMEERHIKMASTIQTKAMQRLIEMDVNELNVSQTLSYLLEGTRLERLSRGEPEQIEERRERIDAHVEHDISDVVEKYSPALEALMQRRALSSEPNGHHENGHSEVTNGHGG